ncbi:hypothetical protein [Saccharopolyspora spinosa]|uniref:Uncharacterized protein n=1 Tax=Saccharopolyspora spinosa TaxID=60894 RepID=A0A2N3Y8E8_SACSN|nr:hypothetical protein [Saccharopolyspora spinosa]PKW19199.1 hypothetical protein A8926_7360 [Saccharopolyspora spinosa]
MIFSTTAVGDTATGSIGRGPHAHTDAGVGAPEMAQDRSSVRVRLRAEPGRRQQLDAAASRCTPGWEGKTRRGVLPPTSGLGMTG